MSSDEVTAQTHWRRRIEAHLEAAWLRRCGYKETPGKWAVGPELLEITDVKGCEIEVYPTYAVMRRWAPTMWGSSLNPRRQDVVDAWQWEIRFGWDDLDQVEADRFEDLGMCLDDRGMSIHVLGSHQEKPAIPDGLVEAVVFVAASAVPA